MKLYHGTNASNINDVIDNAKMTNNINGFGFYLTNDEDVARRYGAKVICWEVDINIPMIVRPIDQSYNEGFITYQEAADAGLEFVITTPKGLNMLLLDHDDVYTV